MADSDFVTEAQMNALVTAVYTAINNAGGGGSSVFSYCQIRNTDDTTDINVADPGATIPIGGTVDHTEADYTPASDSITVNFTGTVSVYANVSQHSPFNARTNVECWLTLNGTKISGIGASGYIRLDDGHNESSSNIMATFDVTSGDVIRVHGRLQANTGGVFQRVGESSLSVIRHA